MAESSWPARDPEIVLPFKWLSLASTLLPVVGIYLCIVYTLLDSSKGDLPLPDCPNVYSVLPPISYVIGIWQPQRYFWMLILFVHFPARLIIGTMYPQVWPSTGQLSPRTFIFWSCFTEGVSLVLLSVFHVESIFGFKIHAFFFITWTASSISTMIVIVQWTFKIKLHLKPEQFLKSFILKVILLVIFIISTVSVSILYPISRRFCDKNAYLAFCIIEYIMVGVNGWFWYLNLSEAATVYEGIRITAIRWKNNDESEEHGKKDNA